VRQALLSLVLTLYAIPITAQQLERPQDLWLLKTQQLTDDLLKDTVSLTTLDSAVVLAQLGEAWWSADPKRARKWLVKAVECVEAVPSKESAKERSRRLAVARSLLITVGQRDAKLGDRLQTALTAETASDVDEGANAEALVELAIGLSRSDPKRAGRIGSAALRAGRPENFHHLLMDLRLVDVQTSDELFSEALRVAAIDSSEAFLNSLRYAAFPQLYGNSVNPSSKAPSTLQIAVLQLLAEDLQRRAALASNAQTKDCRFTALTLQLLPQFDELLPQQSDLVRQIVKSCHERNPSSQVLNAESRAGESLTTVEGLLKVADEPGQSRPRRSLYLSQAARLAASQKDHERAIDILDRMNDDERKFSGMWDTWRRDWAASLASEYLKRGDLSGMSQVIKKVPDKIRPFAIILLVDKLPGDSFQSTASDLLEESRKGVGGSEVADSEKMYWFLELARLFAKQLANTQAIDSFKDAMSALDRSQADPPSEGFRLSDDPGRRFVRANFPPLLLEGQDFIIRDLVSKLSGGEKRAQARLDLLRVAMKQYLALLQRQRTNRSQS